MRKKQIFQRIMELFTQKIVSKLSKIRVWDPRSGIRKKPIPDPGSRGQKGTGSRIRIRNTGHNSSRCVNHTPTVRLRHYTVQVTSKMADLWELALLGEVEEELAPVHILHHEAEPVLRREGVF